MFLTAANLFFYLRDVDLCTADDVVEGQFAITETGRRNRNFIVTRGEGRSLFVKQIPMRHPEMMRALCREAACAQAASGSSGGALAKVMPRLLRYDPACHALVYALIDGGESLNQHVARTGPLAPMLATDLGGALGRCHAETAKPGSLTDMAPVLSGEPPWILNILERPELVMPGMSPTRRQLVETLSALPGLQKTFKALSMGWRRICLVHGDIKNDNVLVRGAADRAEIYLIDWELADLGDPLWDVASTLVSLLQPWLLGASMAGRPAVLEHAPVHVTAASRACWSSYRGAVGPVLTWDGGEAIRLAWLIAARFALLGFELLPDGAVPPPQLAQVVSLAVYFASDPLNALDRVFALRPAAEIASRPTIHPTLRAIP